MYNKKLLSKIDLGKFTKSDPYKKDIIYDPMGQWKYPGQNTRIPSSNITMKGLNKPLLGVASTGEKKMMQPGQEYNFPGANYVDEFPQAKEGMIVDLTPAQIEEYRKGGYIIEDLDDYAEGGGPTDCPKDHVWDANTKKCVKVYTLANDQKFIDGVGNWAMQSSNPDKISSEYNDQIKHYLYSGNYGYDPVSGTLYPLKKEQKTVADAETKKILAKQDDKAAYTQSIIDAGFDPETFGKSKGTNVITGEEIYGDKSKEDVDKINKEAVNDFVTEGHKQAILKSPFNLAAYFTPAGMAAGVIQGGAALLPDIYNFGKDPSWSSAGAVGMDALMMLPAARGIGKFLGYVPKKLPGSPNAISSVDDAVSSADDVVTELRNELSKEGIISQQKTLNLPWKEPIRKTVKPWNYDVKEKIADIKTLFKDSKNPDYFDIDKAYKEYVTYQKSQGVQNFSTKEAYTEAIKKGLDETRFMESQRDVLNHRFDNRFSEKKGASPSYGFSSDVDANVDLVKNRWATWDMYLGKPQTKHPMYDISELTKSKKDVVYTIKENFIGKEEVGYRLDDYISEIEGLENGVSRGAGETNSITKKGDSWIVPDTDTGMFGTMGGFHWKIEKMLDGNYKAIANDVWDLQPLKNQKIGNSKTILGKILNKAIKPIKNIEVGKALGIGKPLNVKVGFIIDGKTKKIINTFGLAPLIGAGVALGTTQNKYGGLHKFLGGGPTDCPPGYEKDYLGINCIPMTVPEQVNDEDWYKNWYANRTIQDKEGQELLETARPKILKRTENFPEIIRYSDPLTSELGSFEPQTGKITLNDASLKNNPFRKNEVLFHEKGHYLTSPSLVNPETDTPEKVDAHPIQQLRNYEAGVVEEALKPRKDVPRKDRKYYDYLKGKGKNKKYTEEISKMLMGARRLGEFQPDQEITDEDIENLYKKAEEKGWLNPSSDFFSEPLYNLKEYTKSPEQIKMLFNKLAENKSDNNNKYETQMVKYGGGLHKFVGGGMPDPGDVTCPDDRYEFNPITGRCVLIKGEPGFIKNDVGEWVQDVAGKIVVEDANDERYKDYLIRKHLSDISKIPDFSRRASVLSDFIKTTNDPTIPADDDYRYWETYYDPEKGYDWTKGGIYNELEDDTNKGDYGSRVQLFNNLTEDQLNETAAQQLLNDQGFPIEDHLYLNDYKQNVLANYIPDSYLGRASLYSLGTGYYSINNGAAADEFRTPINSAVIEDKIDRDRLRKIYPDITDKDINEAFQRAANSYISNDIDPQTTYNIRANLLDNKTRNETIMSNQNDNAFKDFVNSTKNTDEMITRDNHVYYKPESVVDYIGANLEVLPNYLEPVDKYIVKKTLADADPSVELYTNPDAPEYSLTDNTMTIPTVSIDKGNAKRYFDKLHKNKGMANKGSTYRPRSLDFGKKEVTRLIPSLVQKATGYDKNYMEGYMDDDGNYIPGEIENAQTEGRQINFKGNSSLKDKKAQKEYIQEWTQYQIDKEAIKKQNIDLLEKYGLSTEEYLKNYKKQGGSISKYNINTEHDLTDAEVARLKKLGYKLQKL